MSKYLHKSPLSHICTNHSLCYIHSVNIWWCTSNSDLAITSFGAMPPESTNDLPRRGRPCVTMRGQDRYSMNTHLRNRFQTATATANTPGLNNNRISSQTVHNCQRENGLHARRSYVGYSDAGILFFFLTTHRTMIERSYHGATFLFDDTGFNILYFLFTYFLFLLLIFFKFQITKCAGIWLKDNIPFFFFSNIQMQSVSIYVKSADLWFVDCIRKKWIF